MVLAGSGVIQPHFISLRRSIRNNWHLKYSRQSKQEVSLTLTTHNIATQLHIKHILQSRMLPQNAIQPLALLRGRKRKAPGHGVQLLEPHALEIPRKLHRQRLAQKTLLHEPRHVAFHRPRVRVLLRGLRRVLLDPRNQRLLSLDQGSRVRGIDTTWKSPSTSAEG